MIELRNVTKTYSRAHTHAIKDLSFQVNEGEFIYITGHSGAGKSTVLGLILRRILPTSGQVLVAGHDISQIRQSRIPYLRRKIGMVFQDHRLLKNLNALDNVTFALRAIGENEDLEQRSLAMLRQVGLAHKRKAYPMELSLGEQQRVAIARALVTDPPLLLCDEPTGNLDPNTSWEILELLNEINLSGTTILVATHARELVDQMRRRTLVLRNGTVVRDDESGGFSL